MSDLKENMVGDSDSEMGDSELGSAVSKKPKHLWWDPALPEG